MLGSYCYAYAPLEALALRRANRTRDWAPSSRLAETSGHAACLSLGHARTHPRGEVKRAWVA